MALITDKPADLKPQNDLDKISQEELGPLPQMIRLSGRDLFEMDSPPATGQYIKAEVIMRAGDLLLKAPDADGVSRHVRIMQYVGAKLTVEPYTPEPEPEPEPDPAMIDEDGSIPADDEGDLDDDQ